MRVSWMERRTNGGIMCTKRGINKSCMMLSTIKYSRWNMIGLYIMVGGKFNGKIDRPRHHINVSKR